MIFLDFAEADEILSEAKAAYRSDPTPENLRAWGDALGRLRELTCVPEAGSPYQSQELTRTVWSPVTGEALATVPPGPIRAVATSTPWAFWPFRNS